MFPSQPLAAERASESPLSGRVLFLLATPESGAELVLRALGCLPDVTAAPVPTNLFSEGIGLVVEQWISGTDTERYHGLLALVDDEQELLWSARCLADELLAPLRNGREEWLVEFSPDHIAIAPAIALVYPDAQFLQIVRDGREVAAQLASPSRTPYRLKRDQPRGLLPSGPTSGRPGWRERAAARRWCDDQGAMPTDLEDFPNVRVARIERILEQPAAFLDWITGDVGIQTTSEDVARAVAALGGGAWRLPRQPTGRAQALVEALGAELLEEHDYPPAGVGTARQLAGRTELAIVDGVQRIAKAGVDISGRVQKASNRRRATLESQEES